MFHASRRAAQAALAAAALLGPGPRSARMQERRLERRAARRPAPTAVLEQTDADGQQQQQQLSGASSGAMVVDAADSPRAGANLPAWLQGEPEGFASLAAAGGTTDAKECATGGSVEGGATARRANLDSPEGFHVPDAHERTYTDVGTVYQRKLNDERFFSTKWRPTNVATSLHDAGGMNFGTTQALRRYALANANLSLFVESDLQIRRRVSAAVAQTWFDVMSLLSQLGMAERSPLHRLGQASGIAMDTNALDRHVVRSQRTAHDPSPAEVRRQFQFELATYTPALLASLHTTATVALITRFFALHRQLGVVGLDMSTREARGSTCEGPMPAAVRERGKHAAHARLIEKAAAALAAMLTRRAGLLAACHLDDAARAALEGLPPPEVVTDAKRAVDPEVATVAATRAGALPRVVREARAAAAEAEAAAAFFVGKLREETAAELRRSAALLSAVCDAVEATRLG